MRFESVELHNFMSYGSPSQVVSLSKRGLLSIVGPNGAGKSSIMEAVVWALYGQIMRPGYKGDAIVNRTNGEDCYVTLVMSDDMSSYEITRTRKADRKRGNDLILRVDGIDVSQGTMADTQAMVSTIIGMDFSTFTQSVMMWHGTEPFSRMTDKDQKSVLEDILQINTLSKAREVVKKRVVERQQELATVQERLRSIDEHINDLSVALSKLVDQNNQHSALVLQKKRDLTLKKADLGARIEEVQLTTDLDKLLKTRDNLRHILEDLAKSQRNVQTDRLKVTHSYREKYNALARREGAAQSRLQQIQKDMADFDTLAGKTCPTCKQVFTVEMAEVCGAARDQEDELLRSQEIAPILNAIAKLRAEEAQSLADLDFLENQLRKEAATATAELQIANENLAKRTAALSLIRQLEQQARDVQSEIDSLDGTRSPYAALIEENGQALRRYQRERRLSSYKRDALNIELSHLNYWDHGFGNQGLKSYILDSVLPFLNQKAQEYVDVLSGGEITITFSTQTKLKSGEIRDSFQVLAVNNKGADVYHGNSDGERRRIDLAVGWALADLAASRAKKPIYFMGLDEPFEHLDTAGKDAVAKLLHTVLPKYETILCVTHSDHLRDQFPEEVVVTFENGFSKIS